MTHKPQPAAEDTAATNDAAPPLAAETAAWLRVGHAPPGLLTVDEAAGWLRMSRRQLEQRADIPRLDISVTPGAGRPQWRYRVSDLEEFANRRVILPYAPSLRSA